MKNRTPLICGLALFAAVLLVPLALAGVGTGVLRMYLGGTEVDREAGGSQAYLVEVGNTYTIKVVGITEFKEGNLVKVKVAWTDTAGNPQTDVFDNVEVKRDGTKLYVQVAWTVPTSAKYCETGTVHYGSKPDYIAAGVFSEVGHFHVIPEITLGSLGAVALFLSTLGLFAVHKKRRMH